jgi:hypothetical protein
MKCITNVCYSFDLFTYFLKSTMESADTQYSSEDVQNVIGTLVPMFCYHVTEKISYVACMS